MNWLIIALIPPALFAASNHIDKYLVDRFMQTANPRTLLISTALIGVLLMPFIYAFHHGELFISPTDTALIILSGILFAVGFLPYLVALKTNEASAVAPLFQLSPVFAFALGYFLLGETLNAQQALGCLFIIAGAFFISLDFSGQRFHFKARALGLIALASFSLSLSAILFKFVTVHENFWVTSFWEYAGSGLVAAYWLLQRDIRTQFFGLIKRSPVRFAALNLTTDGLSVIGGLILRYATLLVPIALAWTMNGFLPFFVFLYGIILTRFLPAWGHETLTRRVLAQKFVAIALMIFGTYVINS